MYEDEIDLRPDVDETDLDRAVAASTLAISTIPVIGSLVAEAVKHGIPNQRIERIAHMLQILDRQLGDLQRDVLNQRMRTEEFRDLLEDALWQTTRALTGDRRAHIASLLKNSIAGEELSHEQEKTMLRLLGQLNDSELLILGHFGTDIRGESGAVYWERHKDVLMPPTAADPETDPERLQNDLKQRYRSNIRSMGLTRMSHQDVEEISMVGRMLLRRIDFYSVQGMEEPA